MLNEKLLRQISDTGDLLDLDEAVIEKDYYVTQVIHTLSNLENENFRLIFCGFNSISENFSKSRLKKELKEFREKITSTLIVSGLSVTNDVARNEGRYQQVTLKYTFSFPISATLRPDIKVKFTCRNSVINR